MPNQQYSVEVQEDYLKKITGAKPVQALSELIWNALDADATDVAVTFEYNELETLSEIVVRDNGSGIPRVRAPEFFGRLGGSWKRPGAQTDGGRFLHGQEGRGRFKAFAIGDKAEWAVVYAREGKNWRYTIAMNAADIRQVTITEEVEALGAKSGVTLTISEPHKDFRSFDSQTGIQSLTEVFALYLADYQDISVRVADQRIEPKAVIATRKAFPMADIVADGINHPVRLEIVEWRGISQRALFLCNEKRFPLVQADRRFHVGEFQFSAYLASSYLSLSQKDGSVELAEMQPLIVAAIDEAQKTIKNYFRERATEAARDYVDEWKAEQIYPFAEEPQNPIELVERQVFNIVAVNVTTHLPDFQEAKKTNKAFQLRMLRQAIEKSPEELQMIIQEVLKLPKRKQEDLAQLLRDTTLSAIIGSAKIVADRLRFVEGLDGILFDAETKSKLKERTQLHRILADNAWLFGEEYSLSVDDQSLTEVLRKHKKLLGEDVVIDTPVKHINQERGIVDLMLSRSIPGHRPNELRHLVVELKAPRVKIGSDAIVQVEKYAASVRGDERFRNVRATWEFWAISDDIDEYAKERIRNEDGLINDKSGFEIYVKTWSQVLNENRARLQFFKEKLEYQADRGSSLKHLREQYAKFLEGVVDDDTPAANDNAEEQRAAEG